LIIFMLVVSVVLWWTANHHLVPEESGEEMEGAPQQRQRAALHKERWIDMLIERVTACLLLVAVILLLVFDIR
ncbi:hypothetical protein, partial [Deinococcus alpinitundrae]|uniref:hypothetical protein n=1 Tax=Deinococcus alpinitundrae TaxID=468913 RepID=UPI00137B7CAE